MALETQRQPALPMGSDAGNKHLEAQAASTALYMKGGSQSKTGHEFLDSNHRLSSAGEFRASASPEPPAISH